MNKISITAVVPVYNVQEYLEECLESICNQTESFSEIVLINDGSTDDSKLICEKYCERCNYISLINQENAGLSEARNTGIQAANSRYIVFIDSDDCIKANTVECLRKELANTDYDAVFFGASVWSDLSITESESYYIRNVALCNRDMTGREFFTQAFPSNYIVSACLAVYKKDFLIKNNLSFEKGIYFEDNDFHFRVCMKAQKIKCLKDALYIRRYRSDSIMSGMVSLKKCRDLIKVNQLQWEALEYAGISKKQKISFISNYLIHTWDVISESEYLCDVREQWKELAEIFVKKWLPMYMEHSVEFNDKLALLLMLDEVMPTNVDRKMLREEIEIELLERLKALPLHASDKVIGIYGTGRHTEKLIELYKRYVGEINENRYYIVTENYQGMETYQGYPLITCDQIAEEIDYVLVSSLKFQRDMLKCLEQKGIAESKIIKLYGDNEYCDFASVIRILN